MSLHFESRNAPAGKVEMWHDQIQVIDATGAVVLAIDSTLPQAPDIVAAALASLSE